VRVKGRVEVQRSGSTRCQIIVMAITEGIVTEATPSSAVTESTFDARFAGARPRLLRICAGLVGADEAEDVVQDLYLRARSRQGQLRDPSLFEAWLTRAAVNLCFNRHRSYRRFVGRLPDVWHRRRDVEPDLGLRELIERLPSRERTVVVLHYGHGYRLEEIARLVGTTPVNARTILFRARRRLGEQLREAER
jgi:RNA polymerase sigma-70 factor (ECF subfamily)